MITFTQTSLLISAVLLLVVPNQPFSHVDGFQAVVVSVRNSQLLLPGFTARSSRLNMVQKTTGQEDVSTTVTTSTIVMDHSPVVPQEDSPSLMIVSNTMPLSQSQTSTSSTTTEEERPSSIINNQDEKDPKKMMQQIKDAGLAGVISYALWELGFWTVSIPLTLFGYYEVTGHWPDLSDKEDIAKLSAEAFAFVNFARFAVPLRIGLALSTTPWIQTNVVDKFLKPKENPDD